MHRLRRLIAANKRGPNKRIVGVMANFHPCAREVLDFYSQAGPQGGAAAVQVDFDDMLLRRKDELTGLRLRQRGSARQAARDLADISRAVRKAAKRKWVPEWALPLELWHACLLPGHRWERVMRKAGVGSGEKPADNAAIRKALLAFLEQCRDTGLAPLLWARLRGVFISKGGNKALFKNTWGVFTQCPFAKGFIRGCIGRGIRPRAPAWSHGAEPQGGGTQR